MPTLQDAETRAELRRRVETLRADGLPRWGRFTAPQMVRHITDALRMATGELAVASRPTPFVFRHAPFKQLMIYVLPIPRGLPTVPELLARTPGAKSSEWEADRAAFLAALDRFGARNGDESWPAHPAFGPLTAKGWGALQYRHLNHHLRQFGV
jgi:Protein of unknown function (DUF1569)